MAMDTPIHQSRKEFSLTLITDATPPLCTYADTYKIIIVIVIIIIIETACSTAETSRFSEIHS